MDSDKGTIVLKRPTETTLTMRVTEKTRCLGEKGEAIRFTDLRAGDTVFIASSPDSVRLAGGVEHPPGPDDGRGAPPPLPPLLTPPGAGLQLRATN